MGARHSRMPVIDNPDGPVMFDHFRVLRAIGRGSFGKVCIVEKRGSDRLFAMKYVNKAQCRQRGALSSVLKEAQILRGLDHTFLVNLWYSFQDEEDLFMVTDLYEGGDLRYHIQRGVMFTEDCVRLYIVELALALDYLRTLCVVHRDVKPDNVLLDADGHAHLTDFNIATVLQKGQLATSLSGTKPYMAPEVYKCATSECVGYDCAVDWWSLGVCAYEILALFRPFDIHSTTPAEKVCQLLKLPLAYPKPWKSATINILSKVLTNLPELLTVEPKHRVTSIEALQALPSMATVSVQDILYKRVQPTFIPPKDHLNCDPSLELEEMIMEAKPLHKKKKRLAKQRSLQPIMTTPQDLKIESELANFPNFNRDLENFSKEEDIKTPEER